MPSTTLSELITHSLESALATGAEPPGRFEEPELGLLSIRELVRTVHEESQPAARRERILAALARCYRRHPATAWSAVVLAALRPSLVTIAARLHGDPTGIEEDDLHQQILLEALGVAASIPLGDPPRDLLARFEQRVEAATLRRLSQLARARGWERREEDGDPPPTSGEDVTLDLLTDADPATTLRILRFLYRTEVVSGVLADLALQHGTTPAAIQKRHSRIVRRLLSEHPELFAGFAAAVSETD